MRPSSLSTIFAVKAPSSKNNPLESHFISLIHSAQSSIQIPRIHAQIFRHGLSSSSMVVTQIISSCFIHRFVAYGLKVFHYFDDKNLFVFNALIRGLSDNSRFESSVCGFLDMLRMKVSPDRLTFPFVMKSVAGLGFSSLGQGVHGGAMKFGVDLDTFVRISLVDMYVKIRKMGEAFKAFDESPESVKAESALLWNIMINGYCNAGEMDRAMQLFEQMPIRNTGSWNNMINGFAKSGNTVQAMELFDRLPEKNVISWTTVMNGFSQNGSHKEALVTFSEMLRAGVQPNDITFVSALSSCAKTGALAMGTCIHQFVAKRVSGRINRPLMNSLLDMYTKCGDIKSACKLFARIIDRDLRTWSIMIRGWALHGCFENALDCFEKMKSTGIKPDGTALLGMLAAFSHSGQVDSGLKFFNSMQREYSVQPALKHYTLIVDLYGRAGQLESALSFIESMPISPDFIVWGSLFHACKVHKNIKMAELVSGKLMELELNHPGNYIFMSNAYACAGRWKDVERIRTQMQDLKIEKDRGWSFIEVDGQIHSFVAGQKDHEYTEEIYSKLNEIINGAKEHGYMPETESVLHYIEEEEKEEHLGSHSERLALAFGLIRTQPGMLIRIIKNLRICSDCHSLMKYASMVSNREIVVRDKKRFHHFKDGSCSCKDYW